MARLKGKNGYIAEMEIIRFEEQWSLNKLKNIDYVYWTIYKATFWNTPDYVEVVKMFIKGLQQRKLKVTPHDSLKENWIILLVEEESGPEVKKPKEEIRDEAIASSYSSTDYNL